MKKLQDAIESRGRVISSEVLKTDTFLNHAIDTELMDEIGQAFARAFEKEGITKVMTIESGGIAPAYSAALHLHVPLVFCKKARPITMEQPLTAMVHSFTKNKDYELCLEKFLLEPGDRVLFVDDFLANGDAFKGVCSLIEQAQAELAGVGICVEKSWQRGRKTVQDTGVPLCILASIASMSEDGIVWNSDPSEEEA